MLEKKHFESVQESFMHAGSRTYFFDIKKTKADDYYLTITESKKFIHEDGSHHFKKHKIFLFKEGFQEFSEHLNNAIEFIFEHRGKKIIRKSESDEESTEQ